MKVFLPEPAMPFCVFTIRQWIDTFRNECARRIASTLEYADPEC